MTRRYVLLAHTGGPSPPGDHVDLMIESAPDGALWTWRLSDATWPPTSIERLPDHRRAYLTCEGPVSGDRGEVRRITNGLCQAARHHGGVSVTFDTPPDGWPTEVVLPYRTLTSARPFQ